MKRLNELGKGCAARSKLHLLFSLLAVVVYISAAPANAQSTAEVCRETEKVRDQYGRELSNLEMLIVIKRNDDYWRSTLAELTRAITGGYVAFRLEGDAEFLGLPKPSGSTVDKLALQRTVRDELARQVEKVRDSSMDDLTSQRDRKDEQWKQRVQRLIDLHCQDVLGREQSSAASLVSGEYSVDAAGYPAIWMLTISGTSVSGSGTWECCPGHRVDSIAGSIEGQKIEITRNCQSQGYDQPCVQVYTGTISGSSASGDSTMNGKSLGHWTMTLKKSE